MRDEFNFNWFEPNTKAMTVSIAEYGITFPRNIIELMNCPKHIKLGFDKEKLLIGVQECTEEDEYKISFFTNKPQKYIRINSKSFIRHLGEILEYRFKNAEKFNTKWDNENKLLTIDLSEIKTRKEEVQHEL